ncbi:hypothetical protein LS73_004635 [Helicobacter muridarum]|uniref:Uncharacterized distant relative of cell wall-associated hydrolases n=1 Tax=Helicobacter muridarum TaxID=216 RepID=A0A099TZ95_9HELI|nr:YiiX/YebB-like N1pC/P60 family cysteine hydrolase [Helicobacter muridarum]TLE00474.1 hypothetical protein LS73_004635 [Helicobacter muridarum]STQ86448.1 Uncharacterized distant relative of cell wall-associated hydrolases [Helicobacter muridarum]
MNNYIKRMFLPLGFIFLSLVCFTNPMEGKPAYTTARELNLQHGDLIFVKTSESDFDKAISQATQKDGVSYTHVGIFDMYTDSVLEAEPKLGVVRTKLQKFLEENPHFDIMRLNPKIAKKVDIKASIKRAEKYLGEPYDFTYTPNNGAMYCSELIYEAFLDINGKHVFKANPMNFYAPDGNLPKYWEELFAKLNKPVPQGELGTNPNDLARDEMLIQVKRK